MRRLFRLWRSSARDLTVLWAALRHPHRPGWLLPAVLALAFFAADPFNLVFPVLGVVDDLIVLPLLLHALAALAAASTLGKTPGSREDRVVSVQ